VTKAGRILCTQCMDTHYNDNFKCIIKPTAGNIICPMGTILVDPATSSGGTTTSPVTLSGTYCKPCGSGCLECLADGCEICDIASGFMRNSATTPRTCNKTFTCQDGEYYTTTGCVPCLDSKCAQCDKLGKCMTCKSDFVTHTVTTGAGSN
jgi:hypothetical protein